MASKITIQNQEFEIEPGMSISDAVRGLGFNPSAYVFAIGNTPVPMDSDIPDNAMIRAIRVASGG